MKKGFTLIELLSVIVVIAIISLIAIPQITNVVNNAKKEAGARSVEGHIESVNTELAKKMLLNSDLSDGEYSLTSLDIKTKGNTTCTSYTIKSNTVVSASNCEANGYIYSYNMENGAYILAGSKGSNADIYAKNNGRLHVTGSKLMNSKNQEFRLMGATVGNAKLNNGIGYSKEALRTLKDWGANVVRFFIDGKSTWNGMYSFINNEDKFMNYYFKAIDNAIENDLYVIVNWSPQASSTDPLYVNAKDALTRVAHKYPNNPHILYEIWNEPTNKNRWNDIKEYSNKIIPDIRSISPDSIILVGTPKYDSDIDVVIGETLNYKNIMYTHHTYSESVNLSTLEKVRKVLNAGIPVFETEWGFTDVSKEETSVIDAQTNAYYRFLNKYNLSNTMFCFAKNDEAGSSKFAITKWNMWDDKLPESILKENGLLMKKFLAKTNPLDENLLIGNISNNADYKHSYRLDEWRDKILSIEFKNKLSVPNDAVKTWDLSLVQDNSIIGYLIPAKENGMYKLIISANGKITAPNDSRYLFADLKNLKSIDFTNFDTKYVTTISAMFSNDVSLETLDLSGFDVSHLNRMWSTFNNCNKLKSINLKGWNAKITTWGSVFTNCFNLTEIDLSVFNVEDTTSFSGLFIGNRSLRKIDISTWNPKKIDSLKDIFVHCISLEEIDMSNIDITENTDVTNALKNIKNNVKIIVKNQAVIDKLSPTATNNVNFEIKK